MILTELRALFFLLSSWLLLSAIELTLRSFSVPHLLFVMLVIAVVSFHRDPMRSTLNPTRQLGVQEQCCDSTIEGAGFRNLGRPPV